MLDWFTLALKFLSTGKLRLKKTVLIEGKKRKCLNEHLQANMIGKVVPEEK